MRRTQKISMILKCTEKGKRLSQHQDGLSIDLMRLTIAHFLKQPTKMEIRDTEHTVHIVKVLYSFLALSFHLISCHFNNFHSIYHLKDLNTAILHLKNIQTEPYRHHCLQSQKLSHLLGLATIVGIRMITNTTQMTHRIS